MNKSDVQVKCSTGPLNYTERSTVSNSSETTHKVVDKMNNETPLLHFLHPKHVLVVFSYKNAESLKTFRMFAK